MCFSLRTKCIFVYRLKMVILRLQRTDLRRNSVICYRFLFIHAFISRSLFAISHLYICCRCCCCCSQFIFHKMSQMKEIFFIGICSVSWFVTHTHKTSYFLYYSFTAQLFTIDHLMLQKICAKAKKNETFCAFFLLSFRFFLAIVSVINFFCILFRCHVKSSGIVQMTEAKVQKWLLWVTTKMPNKA